MLQGSFGLIMRCMSLIIMIILCLSCVGEDCVGTGAGQVTVIFKDAPEQRSTDRIGHLNSVHGSIIAYVDSAGREMGFNPRSIGYDTLDVPTYHGYAEIIHLYQACEEIPFLLPEGDSVMVTYDQDARPVIRSLNNDEYTRLYRLPESVPGLVHRNGYSFRSILRNPRFRAAEKYLTDSESQRKYPGLEKIFNEYYVDLDSAENVYNNWRDCFSAKLDSLSQTGKRGREYSRWYRQTLLEDGCPAGRIKQSDSLLRYVTHLHKLMEYPDEGYDSFDYTGRFDYVALDTTLSKAARKSLLRHYIDRINDTGWVPYPDDVVDEYNEKYLNLTSDSSFTRPVMEKPNVSSMDGYTYGIVLQDITGNRLSLAEVIEKHRGKVVYCDLWASWCGPCRKEMPASRRLKERLDSGGVIFMYISSDRNESDWKRAVKEYDLGDIGENYRIVSAESKFLKEIKFRYIPRYLIFDTDGRLVNLDAPRPSSSEIINEIGKYIDWKKRSLSLKY